MDMKAFSDKNVARSTASNGFNHPLDSWSLSDWMVATMGELGEAANVLKKLNRVRDGIPGNSETPEQLKQMFADELADTYIYLDLMCRAARFDVPWRGLSKEYVDHERDPSDHMTLAGATLGRAASYVMGAKAAKTPVLPECFMWLRETAGLLQIVASQFDIDLQSAIRSKFDRTSAKIGYVP